MKVILYYFNKSILNYCTVSTIIDYIDKLSNRFFWDEDSLHGFAVALPFYS